MTNENEELKSRLKETEEELKELKGEKLGQLVWNIINFALLGLFVMSVFWMRDDAIKACENKKAPSEATKKLFGNVTLVYIPEYSNESFINEKNKTNSSIKT